MADRASIEVTVVGRTDVGRVREHNEDNLLVSDLTAANRAKSGETVSLTIGDRGMLLAVADGMGGAASGEIASETAVRTLFEEFIDKGIDEAKEPSAEEVIEALDATLKVANERIYKRGQEETEHRGMGTTMTAGFLLGDGLFLSQVGDSRAYLLRKGKLVQVTKDQSLISQLIEDGTLTEEEAEKLGGRNIILQALGVESSVSVVSKRLEVLNGDVLILCSDGLTGMVSDEEIQSVLTETEDLSKAGERLIARANEAGGRDNITVVLARFEGPGLREPLQPLEVSAEKGGGRPLGGFATADSPPPEKHLMRVLIAAGAGVVLLAVILLLVLTGGSPRTVSFVFTAPGAKATLTYLGEGGGVHEKAFEPGEYQWNLPDLKEGEYELVAELENHEPYRKTVIVKPDQSGAIPVVLVPLPGTLKIESGTPRVTVALFEMTEGGEKPYRAPLEIPDAEGVSLGNVHPGDFRAKVSREPGFLPRTQSFSVGPGEDKVLVLEPLEERRGGVRIECEVEGARVTITEVTDRYQETVLSETLESAATEFRVRVGESYELTVEAKGYRTFTKSGLAVKEGEMQVWPVELESLPGTIEAIGPAGTRVFVYAPGESESIASGVIPPDRPWKKQLPAGSYRVVLKDGAKSQERNVDLSRGGSETVKFE